MRVETLTITMSAIIMVYFIETTSAKNPNITTSVNEGVCDELLENGVTKGLHGLCVAYCEALDCETYGDQVVCSRPANNMLLDNYNKKKKPTDPDMPCIKTECACFDAEELTYFTPVFGVPDVCTNDLDVETESQTCTAVNVNPGSCSPGSIISERNNGGVVVGNRLSNQDPAPFCFFRDFLPDGSSVIRFFRITKEEAIACRDVVEDTCAGGGWSCFD